MYDVIKDIIGHTWESGTYSGDQSYIYYIAGALIVVVTAVVLDMVYRVFSHFWR